MNVDASNVFKVWLSQVHRLWLCLVVRLWRLVIEHMCYHFCSFATQAMGDKIQARLAAVSCGVPVVPGTNGAIASAEEAKAFADDVG